MHKEGEISAKTQIFLIKMVNLPWNVVINMLNKLLIDE